MTETTDIQTTSDGPSAASVCSPLPPCPSCGAEPEYMHADKLGLKHVIACPTGCHAEVGHNSRAAARAAWVKAIAGEIRARVMEENVRMSDGGRET